MYPVGYKNEERNYFLLDFLRQIVKKGIFYGQADRKGGHNGRGGQIIKNAKLKIKP